MKLFDGITESGPIWQSLAVQVFFEIITDTVCTIYETRRGLNPVAVWRRLPKAQLCAGFMLMSVFGFIGGAFRTAFGDNFDACTNKDMCYCVNNGLRPQGVREAYCLLLCPNTSQVCRLGPARRHDATPGSCVAHGDNIAACTNKDMCYCVNNRLRPQGVLEAYCLLLYPNSSGAPGAATGP